LNLVTTRKILVIIFTTSAIP